MASMPNLYFSASPFLQFPHLHLQSRHQRPNPSFVSLPHRRRSLRCSSSSIGRPGREDDDPAVKEVERLLEERRRAQLASRIASGEFTAQQSGWISVVKSGLTKLGPPGELLKELLSRLAGDDGSPEGERLEIPQAKGSFRAVGGQAFFLPLYLFFLPRFSTVLTALSLPFPNQKILFTSKWRSNGSKKATDLLRRMSGVELQDPNREKNENWKTKTKRKFSGLVLVSLDIPFSFSTFRREGNGARENI